MNNEVFRQNTREEANFSRVYFMKLLFRQEPQTPAQEQVLRALLERFGELDEVSKTGALRSYALRCYPVEYRDATVPAQVMLSEASSYDPNEIDAFNRSQLWACEDHEEVLAQCRFQVMLSDFLAAGLPAVQRSELLEGWMQTGLKLFPNCVAVYFPASGVLLKAEDLRQNPYDGVTRFLHGGVNIRLFNIQGTEDKLVDTLGLYALGLPDLQYHFNGLEARDVVSHAFDAANYLLSQGDIIGDGETIEGFAGARWKCQHETALIQPVRSVLDVNTGEHAAGYRE